MKLYFKIFLYLFLFSSCQHQKDEIAEFIRLEKQLAETAKENDKEYYTNIYATYGDGERYAEYTDTILDIANTYDSLVIYGNKAEYKIYESEIRHKIERRKKRLNNKHDAWALEEIDSLLINNPKLDIRFTKNSLRVRLSKVFLHFPQIGFGGSWAYYMFDFNRFLVYTKHDGIIEGQYDVGYIATDDIITYIRLKKNGKAIASNAYSESYIQTKATYTPIDTGVYTLNVFYKVQDPLSGDTILHEEQKPIYVKLKNN